jgi:ribonuclease H / adenosylcobalamin/alpha-ribazole phosphatase
VTAGPVSVVIEADGGSRGNPGKAAYGAVLKEGATGRVLAERAERIGVASNNVAEYRGLIAGLELYREHADGADLEVRMDSKLVVEQMAGRWKIKHPSMRPLALEANRLAPPGTRWTWIPREQNKHADRLANLALDGPEGVVHGGAADAATPRPPASPPAGPPAATTTLLLVQDGGAEQLEATAAWLAPGLPRTAVVLSSSDPGAVAGAQVLGRALGLTPSSDPALTGSGPARIRDRLTEAHAGEVVVLLAAAEVVTGLASLALGLPPGTPLQAELAPGSLSVVEWAAGGARVRVLGGVPRPTVGTPAAASG